MISLVLLVLGLFIISSLYVRFNYAGRLLSKIPGHKPWPLFGATFEVLLSPEAIFKYLRTTFKIFGGITRMYAFNIRVVNIYDPDDVEKILSVNRHNEKRVPYAFLEPWLGQGLLISNGDKWHQRRKLLTPAFHFQILRQFCRTFGDQAQLLVERLQTEIGNPKTDLMPFISRTTLNIMCETSMGTSMHDTDSVADKYFKAIHILGQCIVQRMTRVWLHFSWIFKLSDIESTQKSALKDLHGFTRKIIQERKIYRAGCSPNVNNNEFYDKKSRLALLDLLIDNEKQDKICDEGIREEVDTFMFEGHDTTSAALCFLIMRIANERIIQNRIYEEIQRIFGDSDRSPSIEDLNEMKYLEICIKEALRLYPSVPLLARHITEEVVLSGYKIPPGTICQIHVFDIHRTEKLYPDPDSFIPERFLPENSSKRHPYGYIPFSAGPRNCIGQKFAMLEMKTILCSLLRRYSLEPVTKPQDLEFTADLVLRTNHPIYVRFCDR